MKKLTVILLTLMTSFLFFGCNEATSEPPHIEALTDIVGTWGSFSDGGFLFGFTFFEDGTGYRWHNLEGGFEITSYTLSGSALDFTMNLDDELVHRQGRVTLEKDILTFEDNVYIRVKSIQPDGEGLYWITNMDGETAYYPWTDLLDE